MTRHVWRGSRCRKDQKDYCNPRFDVSLTYCPQPYISIQSTATWYMKDVYKQFLRAGVWVSETYLIPGSAISVQIRLNYDITILKKLTCWHTKWQITDVLVTSQLTVFLRPSQAVGDRYFTLQSKWHNWFYPSGITLLNKLTFIPML